MLSWTSPRSQTSCRRALESASRLQDLVPEAVLVGGSAVALFAALRASHDHEHDHDHDHVVADLRDRFEVLLDAVEREGPWLTNRVRPGKLILGRLGDIETGLRQLAASG
jgi:class 3 adenylate cyclase